MTGDMVELSPARWVGYVLALALLGCGSDRAAEPPTERAPFEDQVTFLDQSQAFLFVVDNSASSAADELRRLFAQQFSDDYGGQSCADPAAWDPIRRTAFIVYASSEGDERFTGPDDDTPALRLDRPVSAQADLSAWADAVSAALTAPPSPSLAKPTPLAALTDSEALLAGLRAPASGREANLSGDVSTGDELIVSVISANEDASPGAAEDYAIAAGGTTLGRFGEHWVQTAVAPAAAGAGADCATNCPATPRFQTWASASQGVSLATWSPGDTGTLEDVPHGSCEGRCLALPPEPAPNCRLFVVPRDPGVCPPELGWFPPDPPLPGDNSSCEVRALEGAALASCQTDLTCADCEPGYCFSEVPELSSNCSEQGKLTFPRVIAGTGPTEPERFRLVCQVE
jgi:hypothetical protein